MTLESPGDFGFVFEEDHMIIVTSSFSRKLCYQNAFLSHQNENPVFSNPSGLKSVLNKLRSLDRLVWTFGLAVEIRLRFKISPSYCGRKTFRVKHPFSIFFGVVCTGSFTDMLLGNTRRGWRMGAGMTRWRERSQPTNVARV